MQTQSTRRFEHGAPYFASLDLGTLLQAQVKMAEIQEKLDAQAKAKAEAEEQGIPFVEGFIDTTGMITGMSEILISLGKTGQSHTIRKLAAIYNASDIELREAEINQKVMAELEEQAASLPFFEALRAAMVFQQELLASLGNAVGSFGPQTAAPAATKSARKAKAGSPSAA